jgi:MFS family permease
MPEESLWNRRFVFLLLAQAGFGFSYSSFLMLPKFMATDLDAGPEAIGAVVAVSAISIVVFLVPAGTMIDRHGRKSFLVGGALLMAISSVGYVLVHEIGLYLYVLRLLQSLAFAFAWTAGAALCVDAAPPRRLGQAIGLFGLCYVVMGAFAPASVETIVEVGGWDAAFLLGAGAALLCAMLSVFVREDTTAVEMSTAVPVPLSAIVSSPEMLRAVLVIGLVGVAFGCAFNFYQPYALDLGIHELRDFFIANSVAAAACRLGLGPFIDRIGLRRVSLASLALYTVVIFAMSRLDVFGLVALGLCMGVGHGLFYPSYSATVLEDCPVAERGRRMAMLQAGLNVGIATSGIVLGGVAAHFGYPTIFRLSAVSLAIALALIALDARRAARPATLAAAPGRPR